MKIPDEVVAIARHLGDLREKVVFVGGMARGMLVTDPAVDGPRPTKDVDVILDVKGGDELAGLLSDGRFRDCLPGHLSPDDVSQQRLPLVLSRLQQIAELAARENRISASGATEWGIRPLAPDRTTRAPTTAARTALGGEVWQPLRSSDISAFAYDRTSRVLTVRFRSGRVYEYYDVPGQVFDGWKTAASAGRYHRRWIRDRYRYRRIRG